MNMSNKTIKISEENYNKIMDIKELKGFNSADNVISNLLPKGVVNETDYELEPPAFMVGSEAISWSMLKNAEINNSWNSEDESATVLFKDDYGVLIRFKIGFEFFINYYHFI